ncbi:MAG: cyclodeaminase/cyclohydrolase family protein [Acidobacteria bacterium]|nr:cyclodeaminase/cyclohydrolase family protein [Acidobacteriota bacterium]
MLIDQTVPAFLDALSSADPTPGGGSAAAMVGATGVSLLVMVAAMPKTRTNAPEERTALDRAHADLSTTREALLGLIDRDASAYDLVIAAFRKPKATDDEKRDRKVAIQEATRVATDIPLETIRVCVDAMRAGQAVAAHGNPSASSDAKVGYRMLLAAALSAKDNVDINLGGLSDVDVRSRLENAAAELAGEAEALHAGVVNARD